MYCVVTEDGYVDVENQIAAMPTDAEHYPMRRFASREEAELVAATIDGATVCPWPIY